MNRLPFLAVAAGLVVAGLALRLPPWHLPLAVHHYAGSVLWGAMLLALTAALRPSSWGPIRTILTAFALATAIEFVRLVHAPALDAFRATLAGEFLLGRLFSPWNLPAYALGIAGAAAATWRPSWGLAAAPRI